MLQKINTIDHWVTEIISDDPVRPEIPIEFRINEAAEMYALWDNKQLLGVTCVSFTQGIPDSVDEMIESSSLNPDTVVFYTIWSYVKGAGRELLNKAVDQILFDNKLIKNVVTLSPKSEMAEKFHIRNGAWKFRENQDTINYAYQLQ
jgi:hypothetical protein